MTSDYRLEYCLPMQLRRLAAGALFASLAAALPDSALAQETRAELLANKREEKAKQLKPYEPGKLERAILYYERSNPIAKLSPRNGFFIKYGYTWKPAGSGIAIAGGWRHDVFDRNARVELEGGYSLLGYRMVRADFFLPRLMNEKLELGVEGSHHYFPQEDFYGLGGGTPQSDRTSYLYEGLQVQGRAGAHARALVQYRGPASGTLTSRSGPAKTIDIRRPRNYSRRRKPRGCSMIRRFS